MLTLKNKTVLVTGATNGLGKTIAEEIAKKGAEVIIVSRNQDKCVATVNHIQQLTGNPNIRYYAADLSVQSDVRNLVRKLTNDLQRLDVLINNAGAWFSKRQLSADGFELTWALNHLSYFLLTHGLLDLLKHTATEYGNARIINQSSLAHHEGAIHWDNLQFEDSWETDGKGSVGPGWAVYSQSKLANVLHAFTVARKLEGTGVVANAVHPSVVVTGFSANNGLIYKLVTPIRRLFNRTTPQRGVAPAVYLATVPEAATISGAYYGPLHKQETVNPIANDIVSQDRLWQVSLEQVGL